MSLKVTASLLALCGREGGEQGTWFRLQEAPFPALLVSHCPVGWKLKQQAGLALYHSDRATEAQHRPNLGQGHTAKPGEHWTPTFTPERQLPPVLCVCVCVCVCTRTCEREISVTVKERSPYPAWDSGQRRVWLGKDECAQVPSPQHPGAGQGPLLGQR